MSTHFLNDQTEYVGVWNCFHKHSVIMCSYGWSKKSFRSRLQKIQIRDDSSRSTCDDKAWKQSEKRFQSIHSLGLLNEFWKNYPTQNTQTHTLTQPPSSSVRLRAVDNKRSWSTQGKPLNFRVNTWFLVKIRVEPCMSAQCLPNWQWQVCVCACVDVWMTMLTYLFPSFHLFCYVQTGV